MVCLKMFLPVTVIVLNLAALSSTHPYTVVFGKKAKPGQFPWQVSLQWPRMKSPGNPAGHFCGGSIIAKNIILTAAHCIIDQIPVEELVVVAGEHDMRKTEGTEQSMKVSERVVHDEWNSTTITNDLALIKLASDLDLSGPFAKTIRLANSNVDATAEPASDKASASGWGSTTNANPETQKVSTVLLYTNFTIIKIPAEDKICGKGDRGSNVCSGDSGGPYMCKDDSSNEFLCGVSSFITGSPNGNYECKQGYACFASVAYGREWIDKTMEKLAY